MTAASAAYLNNALEPTASSFGFAYASGGGSPPALDVEEIFGICKVTRSVSPYPELSGVFPALDSLGCLQTGTTMNEVVPLPIPLEELARFCRRYQVRELALFGSMLGPDHRPESDVDLLVSFQPAARVTFLTLARMQRELEVLLGRKVDLVPKDGLKPVIRDHILATARVLYAA